MKLKKVFCIGAAVLAISGFCARVYYVNTHNYDPEYCIAAQGESVEYDGVKYSIDSAYMWKYDDFYASDKAYLPDKVPEYYNNENAKMLVVNIKVENVRADGEDAYFVQSIPISYYNIVNWYSPQLVAAMNKKETLYPGSIVTIPYELHAGNMTKKQWENIENAEFRLIIGTYPKRNELIISDYEVVE